MLEGGRVMGTRFLVLRDIGNLPAAVRQTLQCQDSSLSAAQNRNKFLLGGKVLVSPLPQNVLTGKEKAENKAIIIKDPANVAAKQPPPQFPPPLKDSSPSAFHISALLGDKALVPPLPKNIFKEREIAENRADIVIHPANVAKPPLQFPPLLKDSSPLVSHFRNVSQLDPDKSVDLIEPAAARKVPRSLSLTKHVASLADGPGEDCLLALLPLAKCSQKIISIFPMQPYHKEDYDNQQGMFCGVVRLNLRSKEEALEWLEEFKETSFTDWRVRRTFPENSKCIVFKKTYRCNHNTLAQYRDTKSIAHAKHTECKASIIITVKNFNMKRSTDTLLSSYPCEIVLDHCHNHPIRARDSLKHRRPGSDVVKAFTEMFRNGYSPSSALQTHQYDIQVQNPSDWFERLADGAQCPNVQWCYHLYRSIFKREYGEPTGEAMLHSLKNAIDKYNEQNGICAKMEIIDSDLIVVLCSPIMKRVHTYLKSSAEIVFLDSGGMMDRHNSRIFTFLAPSIAGALPLGILVTSSESEKIVSAGFKLLQSIYPPKAFYGRGSLGPQIIMTDDSSSERNALRHAFPCSTLLLCLFHVLQAFWRYIWDSKHKVAPDFKEECLLTFKVWCKMEKEDDFKAMYEKFLADPRVNGNTWLKKHIEGLCQRAKEWALCYRSDLLTRGNNTNNYSEATIRRYKEDVMNRLKAYSPVQLFDFLTTRLDAYFERRIACVVNNRKENYTKSKHYVSDIKIKDLVCSESLNDGYYTVKNSTKGTQYLVDMELEICSCPIGKNGAPCKHQFAVSKAFNISSTQFLNVQDEEAVLTLHQIMTTIAPRPGWYAPLNGGPNLETCGSPAPEDNSESNVESGQLLNTAAEDDTATEGGVMVDNEQLVKAKDAWAAINEYVTEGLCNRPEVFVGAVQKFSERFQKTKLLSENAILSAMHNFCAATYGPKALHKNRYINVNNEGRKRRRAGLGGRKCVQQGRPPRSTFTSEHGYAVEQRQNCKAWDRPSQKRTAVPHNLALRIEQQTVGAKKRRL